MTINLTQRSKPQKYSARIVAKELIATDIYQLVFEILEPKELLFLPGQTISLQVAEGINRSMSIASDPRETTRFVLCHDVKPGGPGSKWTIAREVGDIATFMGPLGIFIRDDSNRKKVFIATGTGIAPFRSMLYTASQVPTSLYWGLRYEDGLYWTEEFEAFARSNAWFSFYLSLSQPTQAWSGLSGHVTKHVFEKEKDIAQSEFYLCGNQSMVKEMEQKLLDAGVPKAQIYKELYY